eukprot:jgi/Ulvmu1/11670/UM008_0079.1
MGSPASAVRQAASAYFYVGVWMSVSIGVILFNKWLLAFAGFPFPITLTLWHMCFCSCAGFLCVRFLKVSKRLNMSVEEYMTRVMPIGLLYAASLWLSNSSYLYLSVSFIQMTKSLMPGLVYFSGCWLGTERFSTSILANMILIAAGVVVCAFGETNLVFGGLVVQLTALLFEATRLTLVQVLINSKGMKMDPFQSLYYVSPACLVCLIIPFLVVELPGVRGLLADPTWTFRPPVFLANAFTAFLLNLAVFLLIGKTSALTMNIAGVIKDWTLIYSSYSVFKAPVTALNLAGYVFCCSGVFIYQYLKFQEVKRGVKGHPAPAIAAAEASRAESTPTKGGAGGGNSMARSKAAMMNEMRQIEHALLLEQREAQQQK